MYIRREDKSMDKGTKRVEAINVVDKNNIASGSAAGE